MREQKSTVMAPKFTNLDDFSAGTAPIEPVGGSNCVNRRAALPRDELEWQRLQAAKKPVQTKASTPLLESSPTRAPAENRLPSVGGRRMRLQEVWKPRAESIPDRLHRRHFATSQDDQGIRRHPTKAASDVPHQGSGPLELSTGRQGRLSAAHCLPASKGLHRGHVEPFWNGRCQGSEDAPGFKCGAARQ